MKKSTIEISIHIVLIVLGLAFINLPSLDLRIGIFSTGDGTFLWPSVMGTLINALIFYGNSFYLIPQFLSQEKKSLYVLLLLAGLLSLTTVEVALDIQFARYYSIDFESKDGIGEIVLLVSIINVLTLILSFAFRFTKDWLQNEKQKQVLKEEKLIAELAFLKSQINPHFLFNTLNNLFSMAIQQNDQLTAEGIRKLAGMMRYMLHDSNSELIELSKELEYIQNYIELQRIRFQTHTNNQIHLQIIGNATQIRVAPMLFIPFIENAFKHGISLSNPTPIHITFELTEQTLIFTCCNTIYKNKRTDMNEPSGIGLENTKKRLAIVYPHSHSLIFNTQHEKFLVTLTINLK